MGIDERLRYRFTDDIEPRQEFRRSAESLRDFRYGG